VLCRKLRRGPVMTVGRARIEALESHGIIERRMYSEHPLRAEYYLTSLGRSFEPIVTALYEWGMKHAVSPAERLAIRKRIAEGAAARGIAIKPPA